MRLSDWSEEGIISHIKQLFPPLSAGVGIGDDCAVIPKSAEESYLITTDILTEGVHFKKDTIDPTDLGWKAAAVNLSDVAAMGGRPLYALLSGALPKATHAEWLKKFIEGFSACLIKYQVHLIGGDTTAAKGDLFFNVTVVGIAHREKIKYRHTAQVGDVICVTGDLGNSYGGLLSIESKHESQDLKAAHVRPIPRIAEGEWLASQGGIHAMMDLSDGLHQDLNRMMQSSACGSEITCEQIPVSKALTELAKTLEKNPLQLAIEGGEEYELLLTVAPEEVTSLQGTFTKEFGKPLYIIGFVTSQTGVVTYVLDGKPLECTLGGFDHF